MSVRKPFFFSTKTKSKSKSKSKSKCTLYSFVLAHFKKSNLGVLKNRIISNNSHNPPATVTVVVGKKTKVVEATSEALSSSSVFQEILNCFIFFGASLRVCFQKELQGADGYVELDSTVIKGRKQLVRVYFPHFINRPNIHISAHVREEAELSATNRNTEVSVKEKKHKEAKRTAMNSNKKDLTKDFMLEAGTRMVFRHILDGGSFRGVVAGPLLLEMKRDKSLVNLIQPLCSRDRTIVTKLVSPKLLLIEMNQDLFWKLLQECYKNQLGKNWILKKLKQVTYCRQITFVSETGRETKMTEDVFFSYLGQIVVIKSVFFSYRERPRKETLCCCPNDNFSGRRSQTELASHSVGTQLCLHHQSPANIRSSSS